MLIGLNGRAGAGKDTVYERLEWLLGKDATVERRAFADKVYELAAAGMDTTVEWLRLMKHRDEVRQYLQNIGHGARLVFGESFWVDQVDLSHERRVVVITDVRYANEAQAISDAGGTVVRVIGPQAVESTEDPHESEAPIPHALVDGAIYNDVRGHGFGRLDAQVLGLVCSLLREERVRG